MITAVCATKCTPTKKQAEPFYQIHLYDDEVNAEIQLLIPKESYNCIIKLSTTNETIVNGAGQIVEIHKFYKL